MIMMGIGLPFASMGCRVSDKDMKDYNSGKVIGFVPFKWGYGKIVAGKKGTLRIVGNKPPRYVYLTYRWIPREMKWSYYSHSMSKENAVTGEIGRLACRSYLDCRDDYNDVKSRNGNPSDVYAESVVTRVSYAQYCKGDHYDDARLVDKIPGKVVFRKKVKAPTHFFVLLRKRRNGLNTEWCRDSSRLKMSDINKNLDDRMEECRKGNVSLNLAIVRVSFVGNDTERFVYPSLDGLDVVRQEESVYSPAVAEENMRKHRESQKLRGEAAKANKLK